MADELIVVDSEYQELDEFFLRQGQRFESAIESYVAALQDIHATGIIAGETADALGEFIQRASALKNTVGEVSRQARMKVIDYVADIDEADEYLY